MAYPFCCAFSSKVFATLMAFTGLKSHPAQGEESNLAELLAQPEMIAPTTSRQMKRQHFFMMKH